MAAKRRKKHNNQPKMSGLDGRGIEWDKRMAGGTGGARFDRCGGNRVGRGGNLGKIHQFINLHYFSTNSQHEIKSFNTAINQSMEVLPGGLQRNIREGCFAIVGSVTKNIKIKIRRCLRWLQNDMKNATVNQKQP